MSLTLGTFFFAMRMSLVAAVPPQYSVVTYTAAYAEDVDPDTLGGILITETGGDWETDSRSPAGARGLFQIMPMWAKHFDYDVEDLDDPVINAHIAAGVVRYSIGRHERCEGKHDWRAHYKCSRKGRDSCRKHVRPVLALERSLRTLAIAPRLKQVKRWAVAFGHQLGGAARE